MKFRVARVFLSPLLLFLLPLTASAAPFAYITNYLSDTVSVIDTATNSVVDTVAVGHHPWGVVVNPTGTRVYVTLGYGDTGVQGAVAVINTTTTPKTVATIPVGSGPYGIAMNPQGTRVYVGNNAGGSGSTVSVIDVSGDKNTVIDTITLGLAPASLTVNPAGTRLYVINSPQSTLSVIDITNDSDLVTATVALNGSRGASGVVVNPSGTTAYIAGPDTGLVHVVDITTNPPTLVKEVSVGGRPQGVAISPNGGRVYVTDGSGTNRVFVMDTTNNSLADTVMVTAAGPFGVSVDPTGAKVYTAGGPNLVSLIDTTVNPNREIGTVIVGSNPIAFGRFIAPNSNSLLTWTQPCSSGPQSGYYAQMVYDSAHRQMVFFGGLGNPNNPTYLTDTWTWDGTAWTKQLPVTSPPGRVGFGMAYDSSRGRVVIFGGASQNEFLTDTWEWDGTNWTQKVNGPGPRLHVGMAYDAARQQVVLYGGSVGTPTPLADTWVYDGNSWTQVSPATTPGPRSNFRMAYDAARQQVVLFGGWNGTSVVNDTWVWDGTNWTQKLPSTAPSARQDFAIAYDSNRQKTLLFSGITPPNNPADNNTYEWDGTNWTQDAPAQNPTGNGRGGISMAYDAAHSQVVMFGGADQTQIFTDTWVFGAPVPTTCAPTIASIFPESGTQGQTISNFTVNGSNFDSTATLSFSGTGVMVNSYSSRTATQIIASIAVASGTSPGARDVIVTNPDSQQATLAAAFTVLSPLPPPSIDSISPPLGNPGQTISMFSVMGTNFSQSSVISFNASSITINSYSLRTPTQILASITLGTKTPAGLYSVIVTNPDGQIATLKNAFTVAPSLPSSLKPSIESVSPFSGMLGQTIDHFTVNGVRFQPGASLSFSGTGITVNSITSVKPTQLIANITIAVNAPLAVQDVIITNPDSLQGRLPDAFTVLPLAWTKLIGPWSSACDGSFGAIAIHPKNPKVIYIGSSDIANGCGFYESTDAGQTWIPINNGFPTIGPLSPHFPAITKIAIAPSDPNILFAGTFVEGGFGAFFGDVFKSLNGGQTWSNASGEISLLGQRQIAKPVLDISIDAKKPAAVFVGLMQDGIFQTANGGTSWTKTRSGTVAIGATDYFTVVRTAPSDGSTTYGAGFTNFSGPSIFCAFLADFFAGGPGGNEDCLGLDGILPLIPVVTSNKGKTWQGFNLPQAGALISDLLVDPSNQKVIYVATTGYSTPVLVSESSKGVFRSPDGGTTWQAINDVNGTNMSQFPISVLAFDPMANSSLYALAGSSGIFKSSNSGNTWQALSAVGLPNATSVGNIAFGSQRIYLLTSNGIYVKAK